MSNRTSARIMDSETLNRLLHLGLDNSLPRADDISIIPTIELMGKNVASYELLRELGRGGAGIVYLARQKGLSRLVAVKVLGNHSFSDTASRARLEREAEVVASLQHPHIVRLYEFGIWEELPFYSMQYIEGTNLRDRIRADDLTWQQAARAAASIAETIYFAHQKGVIHRDLKPENVLIDLDEQLHLADFGLARKIENAPAITVTGILVGTPHYIAPEVLSSYGRDVSVAADQYAIGAILYEMLTGFPPFVGNCLGDVAESIRKLNPVPPSRLRSEIPKQLDAICLKALRKKPNQRYSDTQELAEALNLILIDPAGLVKPSDKFGPRLSLKRPFVLSILICTFVLLLGVMIFLKVGGLQEKQPSVGNVPDAVKAQSLLTIATTIKPSVQPPWTNSLGLKFVPAGTDGVLFSIWDVRVKDFKEFVDATGYDATKGLVSFRIGLWKQGGVTTAIGLWQRRGDTWENPGFAQTNDNPVCGVSWNDANAFCRWLTKKEQTEGKLTTAQSYRLPTDSEWSKAVGLNEDRIGTPKEKSDRIENDANHWGTVFPWGTNYPPPLDAGNFNRDGDGSLASRYSDIPGNDGFPYTSPVGCFKPNAYGLFDMGGNVWNWCEDRYHTTDEFRVLRGSSCFTNAREHMLSSCRAGKDAGLRDVKYGFRIVKVASTAIQ